MSLHLNFEPHSWYMGYAIKDDRADTAGDPWAAYTDDGMRYQVISLTAPTLEKLRAEIRARHLADRNGYGERIARRRLEYLRGELEAERISYGELAELQELAPYIAPDDVQLLEPAGVPEQ